jgi:hypothetical protein
MAFYVKIVMNLQVVYKMEFLEILPALKEGLCSISELVVGKNSH